ncbi:hypothetical protein ILFOPFJJ_04226 [Ensifer psoraleae]|nr:hypothetical protein [Sinorhizobium psoraleae]
MLKAGWAGRKERPRGLKESRRNGFHGIFCVELCQCRIVCVSLGSSSIECVPVWLIKRSAQLQPFNEIWICEPPPPNRNNISEASGDIGTNGFEGPIDPVHKQGIGPHATYILQ